MNKPRWYIVEAGVTSEIIVRAHNREEAKQLAYDDLEERLRDEIRDIYLKPKARPATRQEVKDYGLEDEE